MKHPMIRKTGIIVFWLLVWQAAAMAIDNQVLLATPFQAAGTLAGLLGTAAFWKTVGWSLLRIVMGFVLGLVLALCLAVLAWRFPLAQEVLSPVITLMKAVPVASFVVILLIWWGSSFLAVAVCLLVVLPNIYIHTLEGLKSTDRKLLEMAAVFCMSWKNQFFYIYRPALKPFWEGSLKLTLGMCWKSGVAAELIGTPAFSIGERLYLSKIYLDTAGIFAWTAVIILLSVGFERCFLWLAEIFYAWEPVCSAAGKNRSGGARADVLRCEGLCKSYGEQQVIKGLDAVFESGKIYYLTEPSGSGKTTLLRLLCGLEEADEGSVVPKLTFGCVFQEDRLCEAYSALRNVEMVTGGGTGRGQERGEKALLELLSKEDIQKPCSQLSGGMRRRVALVRAMEAEADCVLLDEPFAGMDAETMECAMAYIRARQDGRILIIATHIGGTTGNVIPQFL